MIEADTAYNKQHNGSMSLKTYDTSNHMNIIANHVKDPNDKAIGVYRWIDALHDFGPKLKVVNKQSLNTLLRNQYGIGTRKRKDEFYKTVNGNQYTFTKTTAGPNTLHENVDYVKINLIDSEGDTNVYYPDNKGNIPMFTYKLPKLLETYDVNTLPATSILEEHPEGDLLLEITGHKKDFDANTRNIKTFLGINDETDTYSKDSANIDTKTFQKIFRPTGTTDLVYDYSFFSEILDPSSEQSNIITTHDVQLTMLYCMIEEKPVYITIKKNKGDIEPWSYAFHTDNNTIPTIFQPVNFNVKSTGAHPAPSIETSVYFIKDQIEVKKFKALLHDVNTIVNRMTNKSKKKLEKFGYILTKKEAQNIQNSGNFYGFYQDLIATFTRDLNLSKQLTPEQVTTIIIAFKTIGDQMYLYDSILLSKENPSNPDRQPWMVTGDTFLKDYSIYTKSTNIMCPTKYLKQSGSRKLTVYIKPQAKLTQAQIDKREQLLIEKKAKLEAEKESREADYDKLKQTPPTLPNVACKDILTRYMNVIKDAKPTGTGRNVTHFDIDIDNTPMKNIHGITLILLYNAIVHVFLTCQNLDNIKTWLDNTEDIVNFKTYDSKQQTAYFQDYKTTLDLYNENIAFINRIAPIKNIPLFINSVLEGVTDSFTGILDMKDPIKTIPGTFYKNSTTHSFDIINTNIISNLKQLHTHKKASTQLLNPFKDFQRQQKSMYDNINRIINNQLDQLITHTGAGIIPNSQTEIINMLKEDIDEFFSYRFLQSQSYYNGLKTELDLINTHQMKKDDPQLPLKKYSLPYLNEKSFELLRNISASYETAIDLCYDNDIDSLEGQTYVPVTYPPVSQSQINSLVPPNATPSNITKKKRDIDEISDSNIFMPQQNDMPQQKLIRIGAGKKTKRNKKKRTHKKQDKKKQNKTKRKKK